jgi:hypothetical protein
MKPPNGNPLDMSNLMTAFTSLTTVSTVNCTLATEKRRVVPGNPTDSYLIKKLLGAPALPAMCGMRMPRTPMRTDPPGCVDVATDGGVDAGTPDALPVVDGGGDGGGDAAPPQAAPRACLGTADMTAIRTWITNGAR